MFKFFICLLTIFTIAFNFFGVAPHPDIVDKYKKSNNTKQLSSRLNVMKTKGMDNAIKVFPTTGTHKVLVILIAYKNVSFNAVSSKTFYNNLFNGGGNTTLTMKKYYQDMSNNQLNLEFTIVGPVTAANNSSYYGQNDLMGNDYYPATLVGEAVDLINASVNFSQFDNDKDGKVDGIVVIHTGPGEEISDNENDIWSHRWSLSSAKSYGDGTGARKYDGVTIDDYCIQPEYRYSAGDSTIGVFCHEFGHILGLPDLYDTLYTTDGVGLWSLMAAGSYGGPNYNGAYPSPLLAWEKNRLGWLNVTTLAKTSIKCISTNYLQYASSGILGIILLLSFILVLIFGKKKNIKSIFLPAFLMIFILPVFFINYSGCTSQINSTDSSDNNKDPDPIQANLKVKSLTVPSSGTQGTEISINLEIENTGNTDAKAFQSNIYLSTDNNINSSDILIGSFTNDTGLKAKSFLTVTINYILPNVLGIYYIGCIIDTANTVAESNENDNITTGTAAKLINITKPLIHASITNIETSHQALKISTGYTYSGGEQYYLIENKVKIPDTWTAYLPGDGLLICLIDDYMINSTFSMNLINAMSVHGVTVIEADQNNGLWILGGDYGSATDTFYNGNVSNVDLMRNNYQSGSGTAINTASGLHLLNISSKGITMTFDYYRD